MAATTLNIPHPYHTDSAVVWLQNIIESRRLGHNDQTFVILRKPDDMLIGAIGIRPEAKYKRAEIGYWVGVSYWNQGYMTEAVRRILHFGFDELDLNRINASYFTNNPASARVMQKTGMTFEGIMRQHIYKWNQFIDLGFYSILKSEFEAQRTES